MRYSWRERQKIRVYRNTQVMHLKNSREIKFTKMHGCGNDYIYINCMESAFPDDIENLAIEMSRRHFSVGGDGVVCICPPDSNDNSAKMRMFNADGSEGKMCGNAIRCVGKFLYDHGYTDKPKVSIETLSGVKKLDLKLSDDGRECIGAAVDMGAAILKPSEIPVMWDGERMISENVEVNGKQYAMTAVSMGNPHCVIFCKTADEVRGLRLDGIGPAFENNAIFPERVNTEFAYMHSPSLIEMRVWERGSGETFACGTGACATVVAAVLNGYAKRGEAVTVRLIGGDLRITVGEDMRVTMEGPATAVYDGVYRA